MAESNMSVPLDQLQIEELARCERSLLYLPSIGSLKDPQSSPDAKLSSPPLVKVLGVNSSREVSPMKNNGSDPVEPLCDDYSTPKKSFMDALAESFNIDQSNFSGIKKESSSLGDNGHHLPRRYERLTLEEEKESPP
jgi:hypothetical protein